jgi:hypothetical protein
MLTVALQEAFDRMQDFLAVQAADGLPLELAQVLCLQESVGVDDQTRAVFARCLGEVQPNAPAGAVLLGLLVGLSAAQLQAERT